MPDRGFPETPAPLRRRLGSPVLWGFVQAFIAAGFYFSLGLVADRAQGWTWAVYLAAACFFALTALSYVEGASLHQERGGVTVVARYAFNELWSFIAGWAILLDYLVLIALTSFAAANHLGVLLPVLGHAGAEVLVAIALIALAALVNLRGIDPKRFERFFFFALADLGVQVLLLVIGVIVLLDPGVLGGGGVRAGAVGFEDLVFAFTLAVVAFTALDASSGFSGQVAISRTGLKRLLSARVLSMLVAYAGLALVASSVPGGAAGAQEAPLIGVIDRIDEDLVRDTLRTVVAVSASFVLFTACIGAMLGLSRLGYSLAVNRQIPSAVGRLHPVHKTPVVVILVGAVLSAGLVVPADMEVLAAIYAFGATLAFTLLHLSVLALRRREPDRDRPFRIPVNVRVGRTDLPVPALLGALVSISALVSVLVLHPTSRIVGPAWLLAGIVLYVVYRTGSEKSLTKRLTVPEETLTRTDPVDAAYGSILVPVLGTALDDDIVQTAGRLAAEEATDDAEDGGAQIEAIWVFEVPMSLPLDGRLADGELKRARAALRRAKLVGEEYEGVTVNEATVRARNAGQAIVKEAKRRGVEAIVMPAEEPTRVRGGVLLGGKEGLRGTFVGETTRYVVTKAPCRVILTAPPDPERRRRTSERPGAPELGGDPARPIRRATERLRRRPGAGASGDGRP